MNIVYLKLTNHCQLRCKHCYVGNCTSSDVYMNKYVFEKSISYIRTLASNSDEHTLVVFHGGEPTLAGITVMESVINELKDVKNLSFNITTNLVYILNDSIIEFFKKCTDDSGKSSISTSWDYDIRFHHNTEDLWVSNVKYLLKNDIDVNPIICVTKQLIERYQNTDELFEFFSSIGITKLNFERITLTGRAKDNDIKPLNKDIDEWLVKAYKSSKKYNINVVMFSLLENVIHCGTYEGCRKRECTKCVKTINTDGSVSGCPNTYNIEFGDVFGNTNFETIKIEQSKEQYRDVNCYICPYYKYCNGECYQLTNDESGCPGLKQLIDVIKDSI